MNIIEILLRNGVHFRQSGEEVSLCCPWCLEKRGDEDKSFSFNVNTRTGAGKCWHQRCSYRNRFAAQALVKHLKLHGQLNNVYQEPDSQVQEIPELPEDFQPLYKIRESKDELDQIALTYIYERGISPLQWRDYNIGVSYSGRYAYRIVFPVMVKNCLKGIVARDFTTKRIPKYLMNRGDKYLFGFDPDAKTVILSEGVFKALRIALLRQEGCTSASLLGHDLTDFQLQQIQESNCKNVIIWPDPDIVGRLGVIKIVDKLRSRWKGDVRVVWPIKQPADELRLRTLNEIYSHNRLEFNWALSQKLLLAI